MKKFVLFIVLSVLLLSLLIQTSFGGRGPPEEIRARVQNAKFIDWPIEEKVIHILGWITLPVPPYEGGTVATLDRGSPILFGDELAGNMPDLIELKENTDYNRRLRIDGIIVADNLRTFLQDPFVAQPGVGPDWTWDHDGDGLGDGNGNGVGDWIGPVMFWRFEITPKLSFGDHIWEFEETFDNWQTTFLYSDGILRIVE